MLIDTDTASSDITHGGPFTTSDTVYLCVVDEDGNAYTEPNYTFDDLGRAVIIGDHEILQSAIFDYRQP